MASRGDGPPPRKSRRIQNRRPVSASFEQEANRQRLQNINVQSTQNISQQHQTSDDESLQNKISNAIMAAIPQITTYVVAAFTAAGLPLHNLQSNIASVTTSQTQPLQLPVNNTALSDSNIIRNTDHSENIQHANTAVNTSNIQSGTIVHTENNPHVNSEVAHTNVQCGNTVPTSHHINSNIYSGNPNIQCRNTVESNSVNSQHVNTNISTDHINIHRFTTENSSAVNTDVTSSNANVQDVQGINVNSTYPVPHGKQSISKPLWLGVDSKTKAKIWAQ